MPQFVSVQLVNISTISLLLIRGLYLSHFGVPLLVGGLVAIFYVPRNIGNLIIPIDELIFFRGVAQPPTRNDDYSSMIIWCFPKMEVAQNDLFMFGEILLEWMMTGGNRISGNLHFYD